MIDGAAIDHGDVWSLDWDFGAPGILITRSIVYLAKILVKVDVEVLNL